MPFLSKEQLVDSDFQMRYYVLILLKGLQNCERSKLKVKEILHASGGTRLKKELITLDVDILKVD